MTPTQSYAEARELAQTVIIALILATVTFCVQSTSSKALAPQLVNTPGSPITLCTPNGISTGDAQKNIVNIAQQMATLERSNANLSSPSLASLLSQYNALVKKYDTCASSTWN